MNIKCVKSQKVMRLHEYWRAVKGARRMPARADIDPAAIKSILPNLLLTEVEFEPFRVRYRIVGTEVVRATGVEFTNRYLDELAFCDRLDYWVHQYRSCCESREPIFGPGLLNHAGRRIRSFEWGSEWVILPLSTNGADVHMMIGVEDYDHPIADADSEMTLR